MGQFGFERSGTYGYLGLIKETTVGTPLTPTDWVPVYKTSLGTDLNQVMDNPAAGNKFEIFNVLQGNRSHKGSLEVMAEPNTVARFFDMLLTQGTPSGGSDPYTHPFTLDANTNPKSYTIDVSYGNQVSRFFGVQAHKISPKFEKGEMRLDMSVSALGSFTARRIDSISTTAVTLDSSVDPRPTKGLVIGDLIRLYKVSDGTHTDFTVASLTDTIVTLNATAAAYATGDLLHLRPATASFSDLVFSPFLWGRSEVYFAADAATALTNSATLSKQTRLESGSMWEIEHKFESDDGSQRSGDFDPATLVRMQGNASLKIKKFFDTPEDMNQWRQISKSAVLWRHYSGSNHELRLTFNNVRLKDKVQPDLEPSKVMYSDMDGQPTYDQSDGQAFDVKVINALATV